MSRILQRTAASLGLAVASLVLCASTASARPWQDPQNTDRSAIRVVTVIEQRLTLDELVLEALAGAALSGAGFVTVTAARRRHFRLFALHA